MMHNKLKNMFGAEAYKPKQQPAVKVSADIDAPEPVTEIAANGVGLNYIDCSEQDVIRVSFVFRAGTSMQEVPFSASVAANMLAEGSALHDAKQIAEELDFYGSYYDVALDRDYSVITFASLSKYFPQTMGIAREILLMPVFPENELGIYCLKRKQRLALERSKVSFKARELFAGSLFGREHPYGESFPEELYDGVTRECVESFYKRRYTAENCFVVSSGKVGGAERRIIKGLAEEIPSGVKAGEPFMPDPVSERFVFKGHGDALQSAVRIGKRMFPRTHPDYIAMQVVATILGGYFGSRLVRNLREERGYTYGVFAGMVNMQLDGYLAIATEVAAGATGDAVVQIFREVERLRTAPVTEEELDTVKNIMTGEVMRILDGPFGIADVTIENKQNGTDNGYLGRFMKEVAAITPEYVMETARKYLGPEDFCTVVVGDPSLEGKVKAIY